MNVFIIKFSVTRNELYGKQPFIPKKKVMGKITKIYPEETLCKMISRIIIEMEEKENDTT